MQICLLAFKVGISLFIDVENTDLAIQNHMIYPDQNIVILKAKGEISNFWKIDVWALKSTSYYFYYYNRVPDVWEPSYNQIQGQRANFKNQEGETQKIKKCVRGSFGIFMISYPVGQQQLNLNWQLNINRSIIWAISVNWSQIYAKIICKDRFILLVCLFCQFYN